MSGLEPDSKLVLWREEVVGEQLFHGATLFAFHTNTAVDDVAYLRILPRATIEARWLHSLEKSQMIEVECTLPLFPYHLH